MAVGVGALVAVSLWLGDRGTGRVWREHTPALAAGALFGLGDILMKTATEVVRGQTGGFSLASADTLASLAVTFELPLSFAATAIAFMLQQMAFSRGRVSLVVPLIGVAGTALAVVLGAALLREPVSVARAAGVATMLAGLVMRRRRTDRLGGLIPVTQWEPMKSFVSTWDTNVPAMKELRRWSASMVLGSPGVVRYVMFKKSGRKSIGGYEQGTFNVGFD